jgi:chromosome partitioning protein
MTTIIAISNEKGGVAKTTTTLSLGAALAELGYHILLVDLDPQANLTLALGLEPVEAKINSGHVLIEALALRHAIKTTDTENVDLIPCNSKIETAEQFLPLRTGYQNILKHAIESADPLKYDYILFDCPPALGAITLNALTASTLVIIPTQAEISHIVFLSHCLTGAIARIATFTNSCAPHLEKVSSRQPLKLTQNFVKAP